MKRTFKGLFFLIAIALSFIACQDPSSQSMSELNAAAPAPPGTGYYSLTLDTSNAARTILPATNITDFPVYELAFFIVGTNSEYKTVERTSVNLSSPVNLDIGVYDLHVIAYADKGKTRPAAQGSTSGIVISNGVNTNGSVTLSVNIGFGEGTYSWNIGYPNNVIIASMTITPLDEINGTPKQTLYFIGGTPVANKTGGSLTLYSGYYHVDFYLRDNKGQTAELKEILHVYQNLTSTFQYTFNANNFHFLKVKQVIFNEGQNTAKVDFEGLSRNDIYLVKVNNTGNNVNAANTGDVFLSSPPRRQQSYVSFSNVPVPEPLYCTDVYDNHAPIVNRQSPLRRAQQYSIGDRRVFPEVEAVLAAQGKYCDFWVEAFYADLNFFLFQYYTQDLAERFDIIYPALTNIIGYEYGGGPDGDGGADGNSRIQILCHDINGQSGHYLGWVEAEMFCIDIQSFIRSREYMYSTMAHEFQHLIYLSQKYNWSGQSMSSWYVEFLAVMAEDVLADIIGIPRESSNHVIN